MNKAIEMKYRGTSLIRNRAPLGLYSSTCLGPCGGPRGRGGVLMSEVPLYCAHQGCAPTEVILAHFAPSQEIKKKPH